MGVERIGLGKKRGCGSRRSDERGQSVLEFLLMLPMMVGLVVILVKINTVIQVSIVNQQYARAQALWLAFNSPVYPQLRLRVAHLMSDKKPYNQVVIGVSENPAPKQGDYTPRAATHLVARRPGAYPGDGEDKSEPRTRALVRVRDTVTLCTQANVIQSGGGAYVPVQELKAIGQESFLASSPSRLDGMTSSAQFDYCRSPLKYREGSEDES